MLYFAITLRDDSLYGIITKNTGYKSRVQSHLFYHKISKSKLIFLLFLKITFYQEYKPKQRNYLLVAKQAVFCYNFGYE